MRVGTLAFDDVEHFGHGIFEAALVVIDEVVVVRDIGDFLVDLGEARFERVVGLAFAFDQAAAERLAVGGHEEDENRTIEPLPPGSRALHVSADDEILAAFDGASNLAELEALEVAVDIGPLAELACGNSFLEIRPGEEEVIDAVDFALAWLAGGGTGGASYVCPLVQLGDQRIFANPGGAVQHDDERRVTHGVAAPSRDARRRSSQKSG